jgi:hypothetical protein
MNKQHIFSAFLWVVCIVLLVGACQPPAARPNLPVTPALPTLSEPAETTREPATPTPASQPGTSAPTADSTSAVETNVDRSALPDPTLFDIPWRDRSIFRGGLIAHEQEALEQLPGASVYHIDLTIADNLTDVHGRQEVFYTNREDTPLAEVYFRLYPNLSGGSTALSELTVNGQAVTPIFELDDSALRVPLAQPLLPGKQAVIAMNFRTQVPTDESSNYGTFAYLDNVLALAHFYPMLAVYDDKGWNVEIPSPNGDIIHADAAFYLVRIAAPQDLTVVTSGTAVDEQAETNQQVLTIAAGPARDFYLAASADYVLTSEQVGETVVNSYSLADAADGGENVLGYTVDALRSFGDRLGAYPYTELDVIGTGTTALGVEYPGVFALANRIYGEERIGLLEAVTAHEAAHQWFYNAVGNDQVDDPWLDEALAQYLTLLYFQDLYGQAGYDGYRASLTERWGRVDFAETPIDLPVNAYADGQEYSAIVYGRGPLFIEALAEEIGAPAFAAFLRDYYQSHKWEIATGESLKRLAEEHCACDLTELFRAWTRNE